MGCPYCGCGSFYMGDYIGEEPTNIGFNVLVSSECRECGKTFVLRQSYMLLEEYETMTMEEYEECE